MRKESSHGDQTTARWASTHEMHGDSTRTVEELFWLKKAFQQLVYVCFSIALVVLTVFTSRDLLCGT